MYAHEVAAIACTLAPEIFNNVYNAIAREARVMGRLTTSEALVRFKRNAFFSLEFTFFHGRTYCFPGRERLKY